MSDFKPELGFEECWSNTRKERSVRSTMAGSFPTDQTEVDGQGIRLVKVLKMRALMFRLLSIFWEWQSGKRRHRNVGLRCSLLCPKSGMVLGVQQGLRRVLTLRARPTQCRLSS